MQRKVDMKLSNFRELTLLPGGTKIAKVDVETGSFWFKRKITETIAQDKYSVYWYFVSTGGFTPGYQAEQLSKAYTTLAEMKENEN